MEQFHQLQAKLRRIAPKPSKAEQACMLTTGDNPHSRLKWETLRVKPLNVMNHHLVRLGLNCFKDFS